MRMAASVSVRVADKGRGGRGLNGCVWGGGGWVEIRRAFHFQLCDPLKYCENCLECTMIEDWFSGAPEARTSPIVHLKY